MYSEGIDGQHQLGECAGHSKQSTLVLYFNRTILYESDTPNGGAIFYCKRMINPWLYVITAGYAVSDITCDD